LLRCDAVLQYQFFFLDPWFFSWGYIICSLYIIDGGLCRTAAGKERKGEGRGGVDDDTAVVEVHVERNSHLLYGIQDVYDSVAVLRGFGVGLCDTDDVVLNFQDSRSSGLAMDHNL
jgi:hypothetical protein